MWTPQGRVRVGYQGRVADLRALDSLRVGEVDLTCRGDVWLLKVSGRTLHSWAFAQQIAFTRYKAARLGMAFVLVDPSYTSQSCPECGFVSKANRPVRGRLLCTRCGLAGHADHIAARNIAQRAVASWGAVNRPHATGLPSARWDRESKPSKSSEGS
ncbi:zinc ribbon domain-containing protein [Nonomuraea sp. bgisy101]|uniref:zinc ribbon domain-containing protein n=1 Tax=Nonomuraea sp. bgisy101 TaxID=3413784 RepID=UPI003D74D40C